MPNCLSLSASAALALWVCIAASVICICKVNAACGCTSSQAPIFLPRSDSSSRKSEPGNNTSTNNDTTTAPSMTPEPRKSFIRIDDMLIPIDDLERPMSAEGSSGAARFSASPTEYINCVKPWPNGKLYYRFHSTYPSAYKNFIRQSLATLESRTNNLVTFLEFDFYSSISHVTIVNDDGCWSYVGKVYSYSSQELSLEVPGCMLESIVQHEFMHALGFSHEQSRLDRDSYVQILWNNIESDNCNNFAKNTKIIPSDFPSYDYGSVMHYTSTAFACISGLNTISMPNGSTISTRNNLSNYDVAKLKYMYSASNLEYCLSHGRSVVGNWANVVNCLLVICCCISLFH